MPLVDYADVVVFLVGLLNRKVKQVGVAFLVSGLLLIGVVVKVIKDVVVDPCLLCIPVEDI